MELFFLCLTLSPFFNKFRSNLGSFWLVVLFYIAFWNFNFNYVKPVCIHFIFLSVPDFTLVSILVMPWNLYILFMYDMKWTVLKTGYIGLMGYLQRQIIFFQCIKAYWGEILKRFLTYLNFTKYNEINMHHSGAQKHVFY